MSLVSEETLTALRRYCERVAVFPVGWSRWGRALASLLRGNTISEGAFQVPALADTLRAWAADTEFAAMLASSSAMAPYLSLEQLRHIPAVVDLVDVDSQKWFDYAASRAAGGRGCIGSKDVACVPWRSNCPSRLGP